MKGTVMRQMHDKTPYVRLDAAHDFRDLVAGLLATCRKRESSPNARGSNVGLSPERSASIVLHRNGDLYVSYDGIYYQMRFWAVEEYTTLPQARRPVVSGYDPELDCWIGLEPAPHLTN